MIMVVFQKNVLMGLSRIYALPCLAGERANKSPLNIPNWLVKWKKYPMQFINVRRDWSLKWKKSTTIEQI